MCCNIEENFQSSFKILIERSGGGRDVKIPRQGIKVHCELLPRQHNNAATVISYLCYLRHQRIFWHYWFFDCFPNQNTEELNHLNNDIIRYSPWFLSLVSFYASQWCALDEIYISKRSKIPHFYDISLGTSKSNVSFGDHFTYSGQKGIDKLFHGKCTLCKKRILSLITEFRWSHQFKVVRFCSEETKLRLETRGERYLISETWD